MRKASAKSRQNAKKMGFLIALFAYPVAQYIIFWLYVNVQTIALSFQEFDYVSGGYRFVFLDNYKRLIVNLFKDPVMLNAFKNSFHSIGINAIIMPIAIFVSYAFAKKVPGEKIFRVAFYMPSMISVVVLTLCFKYMLVNNPNVFVGPLAKAIGALGIHFDGFDAVDNPAGLWRLVYVYCIWAGLGTNVIMLAGAMNRVPKDITESAKLDGIGFFRELFTIYCPLVMSTISAFILTSVMSVFSFYLVPMFLSGGNIGVNGSMYTIPWFIFEGAQDGNGDRLVDITTIGMIFSLIMLPIIWLTKRITDKLTPDVNF